MGVTYWILAKQQKLQWLLNYREALFFLPDGRDIRKECQIRGVVFWSLSDSEANAILATYSESFSNTKKCYFRKRLLKNCSYIRQRIARLGWLLWTMVLTYARNSLETIYDEESF